MVAAFAQLHGCVQQPSGLACPDIQPYPPRLHDLFVIEPLPCGHVTLEDDLRLAGKEFLDLGLLPPEQEGANDLVQPSNDEELLFLRERHVGPVCERSVEPVLEILTGIENRGEEEIEQRPQLLQTVLNGRSSQEQPSPDMVSRSQSSRQHTVVVLEAVTCIKEILNPNK